MNKSENERRLASHPDCLDIYSVGHRHFVRLRVEVRGKATSEVFEGTSPEDVATKVMLLIVTARITS